jgi:hypothetical protein
MATSSTDSTTEVLPDPVFRDDPGTPPESAPEADETAPDDELVPDELAPPEPPPAETREAQLARENAQYRELLTQMQGQLQQRQQAPPPPQDDIAATLQGIPPEQHEAWRQSFRVLDPRIKAQIQQMLQPVQDQLRQNATFTESMALAQRHPGYAAMAPQIEQARYQEYQRTGVWHPLELVYTVALGASQLQQPQVQRQQRQTERRRTAGRAAAPTTVESHGTRVPAPKRTVEQTYAMTDEQILNLAETNGGIERLRLPSRKRA